MKRLLALLPLTALPTWGQCVMCFRTAAAQQGARAHVLDIGILLLGVPPFLILAGYCFLFYKKNAVTEETLPRDQGTGSPDDSLPR
jgi:hypothetical protein